MNKYVVIIALLSIALSVTGQQKITGYAPDFIGEKVTIYTYQDYLTMNRIIIGEGEVNPKDSSFAIELTTNSTIKGIIEIDRNEASLYIAPETDYAVYFPRSVDPPSYKNAETSLYFSDLDTTDINYLVLQYHQWFDTFIGYYENEVAKGGFLAYLDTFKTYAEEAYKGIDDPYFITYVRYDIAEMEQTTGANRSAEKRLSTFLNYIEPFPVYYENDRYMKFILSFYDKEFRDYLPKTETAIMEALFYKSPTRLMQVLKSDIFLANPELRELIMIDKLGKAFYREVGYRPHILTVLDSVANYAQTEVNASAARNILTYLTNLERGYPAPLINIEKTAEEKISWDTYKGKFVYFNFFATWNDLAMNDMEIIADLVPKYDEDIAFLSVCTDKDRDTYEKFLAAHPEYDWDILYIGENEDLMQAYQVTAVPSYYLIDQDGFIFSAPALAPSPDAKYQSIEKTLAVIQRALHPEENPRVGGR